MDALFKDVPRHALTPFLCIDEFGYARSGPGRYPFILVDGSTSRLLDVVESRQWAYMSPYFRSIPPKERASVRYFSSDMYDPYKSIRNEYFPGAEHAVCMFRIVKQATFALNVARARSAGKDPFDSAECRFAKSHWQILLLRAGDIPAKVFTPAAKGMEPIGFRAAVDAVMAKYPQLLPIRDALQALYSLVDGKATRPYEDEMGWIIRKLLDSGVPQAIDAAGTYRRWERQIRRTFELREKGIMISNSHAEGMNSNISSYIKISRGCPDFERFRKRCLLIYGLRDFDQATNDLTEKAGIGLNKPTNTNQ
jgi:transposase